MRLAMRAASQLPGRGPIDVDVAPVPARVGFEGVKIIYICVFVMI